MAVDTTGVSLSTAEPDNMNHPQALGDGGLWQAEDYAMTEQVYGDNIASMLNAIVAPARKVVRNAQQRVGGRNARPASRPSSNYLLLGGLLVLTLVVLAFAE
jgi:hypothetical protein